MAQQMIRQLRKVALFCAILDHPLGHELRNQFKQAYTGRFSISAQGR
jgi:hypothetical protein